MTEEERQDQIRSDFQATFKTDPGRRTLSHLASICHVYGPCHVPGDPYTTAYQDGQRDTVLTIINLLKPITDEERTAMAESEDAKRQFEETYGVPAPL